MIKAEVKHRGIIRRHKEKGEPSTAGLVFVALDLAKIHLLLFTAVCIKEEAGHQADKEGELSRGQTPRPNADTKKKARHQLRGLVFGARDFAKVHLLSSQQFVLKRRPDAKQRKRVSSP